MAHVLPTDAIPSYPTVPSKSSVAGVWYKAANGDRIDDLGEKVMGIRMPSGATGHMRVNVCGVHKLLLSVAKIVDAGNSVYFSKDWSGITNMKTGKQITIYRENGVYVMELDVLEPDVANVSSPHSGEGDRAWVKEIAALRAEVATSRAGQASDQQMSGERRLAAVRP